MALPLWLRNFLNNVVSGTLIAPFLALVASLIYYRLTAAHAGQPYTPTGPAAPGTTPQPYPGPAGPGPAGPSAAEPPPSTPPDQDPGTSPPPGAP